MEDVHQTPAAEPEQVEELEREDDPEEAPAPAGSVPAAAGGAVDKEKEKKQKEKEKKKAKEAEKKAKEKEKKAKEAEKKASKGGAAKSKTAAVAAQIKQFQEKVKEAEEARRRAEEEAERKRKAEEEARLAALKAEEERKKKLKEKNKAHKKKLQATAAERAAAKRAAEVRAALAIGALTDAAAQGEDAATSPHKPRDRRRRKKPDEAAASSTSPPPAPDATAAEATAAPAAGSAAPAVAGEAPSSADTAPAPDAVTAVPAEDDAADDWEQLLEKEVTAIGVEAEGGEAPQTEEASKAAAEGGVKAGEGEEGQGGEKAGQEEEESSDEGEGEAGEEGEEGESSSDESEESEESDDTRSAKTRGTPVDIHLDVRRGGVPKRTGHNHNARAAPVALTELVPGLKPAPAASTATAAAAEAEVETAEKRAKRREEVLARHRERMTAACEAAAGEGRLRSPICCILGHVDTGKTKLLDKIRRTDVQGGEAGGITQQIGATFFPMTTIQEQTRKLKKAEIKYEIPGLLIIDTPGHESFTNLRSRGSSLCNVAILVVDMMHGIEPQTEESMKLLAMRNTPFVIALNKIDRIYGWQPTPWAPFKETFEKQDEATVCPDGLSTLFKTLFRTKLTEVVTSFAEKGYNVCLHTENKDPRTFISMVPTSAITGEGIPDLLLYLVAMTQRTLREDIILAKEVTATVLEVKVIQGLGTTIDVILSNGILREGDTIVVCGLNGPIATQIRALLTPQPCRELRVKSQYSQHREIMAAMGVKISAQGLEQAVAGSPLHVAYHPEEVEFLQELVQADLASAMSNFEPQEIGVSVQSSTIGSLEALLQYLKGEKVPVSNVAIGPIYKRDVVKASVMLERQQEFATILGFDVTVDPEAQRLADEMGVRIFTAPIIYHLTDMFGKYISDIREQKKARDRAEVVFPCQLTVVPNCIFNRSDPIIIGVRVQAGILRVGTPLVVMTKDDCDLGNVGSIEFNHKPIERATKDMEVAIKILTRPGQQPKMAGRHFDEHDVFCSRVCGQYDMTRKAIDVLKSDFRDELSMDDWKLVATLKQHFSIL